MRITAGIGLSFTSCLIRITGVFSLIRIMGVKEPKWHLGQYSCAHTQWDRTKNIDWKKIATFISHNNSVEKADDAKGKWL